MSDNGDITLEHIQADKKIVKVAFAIPNEGHTEPEAYDNRMVLSQHLGALQVMSHFGLHELDDVKFDYPDGIKFEFHIATVGKVMVQLARERLAENAVNAGMDYLFMIDDDMITPIDLFEKLYKNNVDICAALAFSRYPPYKPVLYDVHQGHDVVSGQDFFVNYPIMNYPKDKLVECDAVGFGAVLIKCDVFKEIKPPWFMSTCGAGEDIHFCWKARGHGIKVFSDTRIKLGHLGVPECVDEALYEKHNNIDALREVESESSKYAQKG